MHLCEFAYNNSFHSSIGLALYEALFYRKCRTLLCWEEVGARSFHEPSLVSATNAKVKQVQGKLKIARSIEESFSDHRRELEIQVRDMVLKVSPLRGTLRFGKTRIIGMEIYWSI